MALFLSVEEQICLPLRQIRRARACEQTFNKKFLLSVFVRIYSITYCTFKLQFNAQYLYLNKIYTGAPVDRSKFVNIDLVD